MTSNLMLTGKNIDLAFFLPPHLWLDTSAQASLGSCNHINHLTFKLEYRRVVLLSKR